MALSVKGIDHFVIRARDLDAAETLFGRLGFTLTPRGFHSGRGSANHTAVFSSGNYFELIYLPPGADPSPFGFRPEGPVAVALEPTDSHAIHAELTALGYESEPPRDLSRPVQLPSGARDARFLNASLPVIAPEAIRFFACQHLTRDLVWRPEWEGHANGADRVVELIVVYAAPSELRGTYATLFGESAVRADTDRLVVTLGEDKISFLAPTAFTSRFPGIPAPEDLSKGWFAGATLRVRSLERVAHILSEAGIFAARAPAGSLVAPPSRAAETLLEFQAA